MAGEVDVPKTMFGGTAIPKTMMAGQIDVPWLQRFRHIPAILPGLIGQLLIYSRRQPYVDPAPELQRTAHAESLGCGRAGEHAPTRRRHTERSCGEVRHVPGSPTWAGWSNRSITGNGIAPTW